MTATQNSTKTPVHAQYCLGSSTRWLATVALVGAALLVSACDEGGSTMPTPTGPDMAMPPPALGLVRIGSSSFTVGPTTYSQSAATALFIDPLSSSAGCARTTVGECTAYRCTGSSFSLPHAGTITLQAGTSPISVTTRGDGSYLEYRNTSGSDFMPGQSVSISAAGSSVPKFASALTLPTGTFAVQSPNASRADLLWAINKTQDFTVTWTPLAANTTARLELTQDLDSNRGIYIECSFPGMRGTGVVPQVLLANLQLTSGTSHVGGIMIGPGVSANVKPTGWDIDVIGIGVGRSGIVNITDK